MAALFSIINFFVYLLETDRYMGYTKAQYIEKFGEDYYNNVVLPQKRKNNNKYVNSEKGKSKRKEWQQSAKGREYSHNYYLNHKEERIKYASEYIKEHKEKIKDYQRAYQKRYRKEEYGRALMLQGAYRYYDTFLRDLDASNNVSADWIIDNIFTSKCVYCGDSDWAHLGCDRIDSSKPHTADNVVCSCGICNVERADKYSVEEFIQYRQLHPRLCDIKIEKAPLKNDKGALIKKPI